MCRNRWRTFMSTLTLTAMEERFRSVRTADFYGRTLWMCRNRWRTFMSTLTLTAREERFRGYGRTLYEPLTSMEERFGCVGTAEELSCQPLHWRLWKNASEVYEPLTSMERTLWMCRNRWRTFMSTLTLTAREERFRSVRTADFYGRTLWMCRNRWRTFMSTLTLTAREERFRGVRTADFYGRTL